MSAFFGAVNVKRGQTLRGLVDAPSLLMGHHIFCGEEAAQDAAAAASVTGRLRNAAALMQTLREGGAELPAAPTLSQLALAAYRRWGEEYWRHLEGPACTAVLDAEKNVLYLTRDPMGDGRVFYAACGEGLAFASKPEPLLKVPGVRPEIDREGLCQLFGLGPARVPGTTPFRAIRELEPGQRLMWDGRITVSRYFQLAARPHEDSPEKTIETVREMLTEITGSLRGLSPLCMLSGGLDSTLLTALLAPEGGSRSFSVDYAENGRYFGQGSLFQGSEDAPFVREASRALRTQHREITLSQQGLADALGEARRARFFPGMADVDSSLLLFCRGLSAHGKYALSGECGDEVFGGYPWFHREEMIWADTFPWSGSLELRRSILRKDVAEKLNLTGYVEDVYRQALKNESALPGEGKREARLRQAQGLCFRYFMANLQERALRMGEYAGVTLLTPYSDERLAQYVYNVPWEMKDMGGMEKGLLREAAKGLLPDRLRLRKKSPYPKTYHPEYGRRAAEMCLRALRKPDSPLARLVDVEAVERLAGSSLSPRDLPWFGQLMTLPQMLGYLWQADDFLRETGAEILL